jgi:hypothetical protein
MFVIDAEHGGQSEHSGCRLPRLLVCDDALLRHRLRVDSSRSTMREEPRKHCLAPLSVCNLHHVALLLPAAGHQDVVCHDGGGAAQR